MPDDLPKQSVILAAGAGSRIEGRCKALLPWRGIPFLEHVLGALSFPGDPLPIVVLGHRAAEVRAAFEGRNDLRWIENPRWAEGQTGSLQAALGELDGQVDAFFVHLVDLPTVKRETVLHLRRAWCHMGGDGVVFRPACEGVAGHPVLLSRSCIPSLLSLPANRSVRSHLQTHGGLRLVEVEDGGILRDVDTLEALRSLEGGEDSSK